MCRLTIKLPESMKDFIVQQAAKGGFKSESEYLQTLVVEAQNRQAQQELEEKLVEGLNSPLSPMTPADWSELKREIQDLGHNFK